MTQAETIKSIKPGRSKTFMVDSYSKALSLKAYAYECLKRGYVEGISTYQTEITTHPTYKDVVAIRLYAVPNEQQILHD